MIDSHCHLADEAFAPDLDAVVARARDAGLTSALCILEASDAAELARAAVVKRAWPAIRFATAIHPHRSGAFAGRIDDASRAARAAAEAVEASAVGEIGLDYHYDFAPRDVQRGVFAAQIAVALELDRPVAIHTREASDDTFAVLAEAGRGRVRGVMHCFSGTSSDLDRALDLGFYVSFAGILTFGKADNVRDAARRVPADRLLVETDAPYLAPVPHRGQRNEPAHVLETLRRLAAIRGETDAAMADRIHANFLAFVSSR